MPNALEILQLTKRYGSALVLDGLSATIPGGRVVGLLGHNGAGKTTLMKLVLGLVRPTAGEVRVLGSVVGPRTLRRLHGRIGYLPENVAFYGNLTGEETITYLAGLKNASPAAGRALLAQLGLAPAAHRTLRTYSKGMRQRLGLAQALLGAPELLLLDEPTTGLDPAATQQFLEVVHDLRAHGRTVVISSHLLAEIEPHLDHAVVLSQGHIVAEGTVAGMREELALPVTVRARVSDGIDGMLQNPLLANVSLSSRVPEPGVVEFDVLPKRKMDVVRYLAGLTQVIDLSVKEPTLAQSYAKIGGRASGPGETRCVPS